MTNRPLLTIVIPTFNRKDSLKNMLKSFLPIQLTSVEILIVDNFSTDGTWEWLNQKKNKLGLKVIQNSANLGIEGNIIQSLQQSAGKYIWLLSDHMQLFTNNLYDFVDRIDQGLEFSLGYARIRQYNDILDNPYRPQEISSISQRKLGELVFCMSNISAFIINREYLSRCYRSVYRFSSYSYPHLGVFTNLKKNDNLVELPMMSQFISESNPNPSSKRISYDTFRSRFIGFPRVVLEIERINPEIKNIKNDALKSKALLGPLISDLILNLCFNKENPPKLTELVFCFRHYPLVIKLFVLPCFFFSLLNTKSRIFLSSIVFKVLLPEKYLVAQSRNSQEYSLEKLKE